ncbi:hypothetical protein [Streptococcus pneumoniae]|uniref:hypothetical protein n=1 Tax=Streptococcus pneumoniae TaxID=1313 RepID=UPI001CD3F68C|nr:hypothetical protein [Streptococcus pneumoniae]
MKIKKQTRKRVVGCSKHCFEVADRTDEVSHIYTARRQSQYKTRFEVVDGTDESVTVLR